MTPELLRKVRALRMEFGVSHACALVTLQNVDNDLEAARLLLTPSVPPPPPGDTP